MLARFEDVEGRGLARAALGDDFALGNGPLGDGAVDGRVPCAETELGARVGDWMGEGVVEEAGAAVYVGVGLDGEGDDRDGVGKRGREIEF